MSVGILILRIFLCGLLGGIVGFEREFRAKEAGIRTHFLVALGSGLFMVISQYGFAGAEHFDASRVAAQVVSGIGFIGAGIIIFQQQVVRGLTTAAGLWVTAAIGMACGGGLYVIAVSSTVFVLLILEATHFILLRYGHKTVSVTLSSPDADRIFALVDRYSKDIVKYNISRQGESYLLTFLLNTRRRDGGIRMIAEKFGDMEGVRIESID